jgi:hypothetical protein
MCHSDEDDELWNTDPQEYIRIKYGKHRNNYYYYEKKVRVLVINSTTEQPPLTSNIM